MTKLSIYCVTNKRIKFLENYPYNLAWVGNQVAPINYLKCDDKKNIFFKEKYYSELAFHYWYWKNLDFVKKEDFGLNQIQKSVSLIKIISKNF